MTLLTRIRDLLGDDTLYECRHCGTTLDSEIDECPTCETRAIARYEIR